MNKLGYKLQIESLRVWGNFFLIGKKTGPCRSLFENARGQKHEGKKQDLSVSLKNTRRSSPRRKGPKADSSPHSKCVIAIFVCWLCNSITHKRILDITKMFGFNTYLFLFFLVKHYDLATPNINTPSQQVLRFQIPSFFE